MNYVDRGKQRERDRERGREIHSETNRPILRVFLYLFSFCLRHRSTEDLNIHEPTIKGRHGGGGGGGWEGLRHNYVFKLLRKTLNI